jgi:peptidoglycan L-alanyl-D-glutamate endopeptidase CwlK
LKIENETKTIENEMLKHEERLEGVNIKLCNVVRLAAKKANFDITVSEGLRTKKRQKQLFDEGKTKTLNSVCL